MFDKKINFLHKINFLKFVNYFNILILKINFKKLNFFYFNIFLNKKIF